MTAFNKAVVLAVALAFGQFADEVTNDESALRLRRHAQNVLNYKKY